MIYGIPAHKIVLNFHGCEPWKFNRIIAIKWVVFDILVHLVTGGSWQILIKGTDQQRCLGSPVDEMFYKTKNYILD